MAFKSDRQRKKVMATIGKRQAVKPVSKNKAVSFPIDLIQAEFMNEDTDISNVWKWKKGQGVTRWTDGSEWIIDKVEQYPKSNIYLVKR